MVLKDNFLGNIIVDQQLHLFTCDRRVYKWFAPPAAYKLLQSSLSPSVFLLLLSNSQQRWATGTVTPRRPTGRSLGILPSSSSLMGGSSPRASPGLRSMAGSRHGASSMGMFRRLGRCASYSPVATDSLDLTQTSVVNSAFKVVRRTNEKEQLQVCFGLLRKDLLVCFMLNYMFHKIKFNRCKQHISSQNRYFHNS